MKRRIGTLLLVAALICSACAGCAKTPTNNDSEVTEDIEFSGLSGAYNYNAAASGLNTKEIELFEKATQDNEGATLEPLAIIGEQVVAGMNYAYLCKSTPVTLNAEPTLIVAIVNADSEGQISLLSTEDFDALTVLDDANEIDEEELCGGFMVPETVNGDALPEEAKNALADAQKEYTGMTFEPCALLGTQVVAGTNYLMVCKATTVTSEPQSGMVLVQVYAGVDGTNSIEAVSAINPADYNIQ